VLVTKKENQKEQWNELALKFEDFFDFSAGADGKRTCSMNIDAMILVLAEGKNTKIISQVIEDITKMN
jgi:hypothetical protein